MFTRVALFLLLLGSTPLDSVSAQGLLDRLVGDGSLLLHSPDGETLLSINPDRSLIPASVVKIPLAQVALTALGEDYRFETRFYRNQEGDLLVRGMGDPFLISEELAIVAGNLAGLGLDNVGRLVVDDSAFEPNPDLPLERGADDPYAARNSALAVNFNTVNLAWDDNGQLISAESQTPLTPLARELGARLRPGAEQRINLGDDPRAGLQQVQQLLIHFLQESGVTINDNTFYLEPIASEWSLFYTHRSSRSLRENLEGMLRYSNNFIANQLFLTLGAQQNGYPAIAESARAVLREKLSELYGEGFGDNPNLLTMIEGSGLAREQRSSATGMMRILEIFIPFADLLPDRNGVLRKSGTLTGVYNYAGYIPGSGGLYPYVILTNQGANNRDEILSLLRERVSQTRPQ